MFWNGNGGYSNVEIQPPPPGGKSVSRPINLIIINILDRSSPLLYMAAQKWVKLHLIYIHSHNKQQFDVDGRQTVDNNNNSTHLLTHKVLNNRGLMLHNKKQLFANVLDEVNLNNNNSKSWSILRWTWLKI